MTKAVRFLRRAFIRWQLYNLDSAIRNIFIARNNALVTMATLQEKRAVKERMLEGMESLHS